MTATFEHITLSEFQIILNSIEVPSETRLTVTFEDAASAMKILKRNKTLKAMKKLKGSGNGNLVTALLEDRARDKHYE
jgi:hypothetical protein